MEEASLSLVIIPSFTLDDSDLITKLSCLTDLTFRQLTSDSISERPDTVALFQGGLNQCNAIFRKYHTKRLQLIHNGVIFSIRCLGYSESSGPHADTLPTIASSKHIPRIRAENGIPRAKNVSILDLIDELGDDILNVTAVFKEFKSADDCISLWGAYSAIKAVLRIDFPMDYLLEGDLLAREGDSNVPRSLSATQKQDVGSGRKRAGARTKEPLKNPRTIQMTYVVFLKLFLKVKRMGLTSTANLNAARNFNLSVGGTPRGSEDISQADIGASLHDNISTSQDIMRRARVRVFQSDRAIHSVNELSHEEDTHSVCTVLDPTNASTSDAFLNCEDTISVPLTSVRMCVSDHTTGTLPLHRLSESGIVPFFSIPSPLPTSSESLEPVYWLTMAPFWEYVASVLERCGCHASNQRGNAAMSIELQGIFLEYDINSMYHTGIKRDLMEGIVMLSDLTHIMTAIIGARVCAIAGIAKCTAVTSRMVVSKAHMRSLTDCWWTDSLIQSASEISADHYHSPSLVPNSLTWPHFLRFLHHLMSRATRELCVLRKLISTEIARNVLMKATRSAKKRLMR